MTSNVEFSQVLRDWGREMMYHSRRDFMRIMRESGLSMTQVQRVAYLRQQWLEELIPHSPKHSVYKSGMHSSC